MKVLLLSLTAVAAIGFMMPARAERDFVGNIYPAECLGDLSYITVPVFFVPPSTLGRRPLGRVLELYVPGPPPMILIDETLSDWKKRDAERHGKCHHIKGQWHQ